MITYCPPDTQIKQQPPLEVRCISFPSLEAFSRWAQQNNITIPCWRWP
jgi:hypothetical protein